jgi:four helix bundle protein
MKIINFTEIDSWIEARELVNKVYKMTGTEKFKKDYGLKDQIQRAGVSIMSNIAEGFDSGSIKAFINFLNYSYRSTSEVQSLLFVALDQCYIVRNEFDELYKKTDKIKNLIGGFIKYLRNSMNEEPRTINKTTTNIEQRTK